MVATGSTVMDSRLILIRPPPVCGPGLSPGLLFSLHAAVAGGLQPTSVSAPLSRAAARARMLGALTSAIADGPGRGRPEQRL